MNPTKCFSITRTTQLSRPHQKRPTVTVRSSQSSDPILQKPVAKPSSVGTGSEATQSGSVNIPSSVESQSVGVTIEYQRQQAKAMQQYFKELKLEESIADSQIFGWTKKNEITNGRWVMMGLAVGLLTEYATAVNFVDQIKLMVSYLGIADIYE